MPAFLAPLTAWLGAALFRVFLAFIGYFQRSRAWLVSTLIFVLVNITASLVFRVLLTLGIGFVVYNLSSFALDALFNRVVASFDALPDEIIIFLKLANVDEFISIVFGALSAKLTLAGVSMANNTQRSARIFYA